MSFTRRGRAGDGVGIYAGGRPALAVSVLPQDFSNMAAVQQGMKSLGFRGTRPTRIASAAGQPAPQPGEIYGCRCTPKNCQLRSARRHDDVPGQLWADADAR